MPPPAPRYEPVNRNQYGCVMAHRVFLANSTTGLTHLASASSCGYFMFAEANTSGFSPGSIMIR